MRGPQFIQHLRLQLQKELPGKAAQAGMSARRVSGQSIRFEQRTDRREGAVLILLYEGSGSWQFPVIRRADYDGVHGGQIGLPGGKKEEEDADLHATALRETAEEIGVKTEDIEILGHLTSFYVGASNYQILPVVGMIRYEPTFVPEEKEVAEVIPIPVGDFLNEANRKEKEIDVRGYPLVAPYFDLSSQFIWGATAMMLNEFKTILKEIYHE